MTPTDPTQLRADAKKILAVYGPRLASQPMPPADPAALIAALATTAPKERP